ncbi:hypothetical protein L249_4186 [Ophiocordyceps polyrhachis-furcata BCC 54312]|uniref:Uncharacterized protein n=1 Tax=Ophiocordyceps polyrhachis-furcata BCC 54312 TaxID=1330021 RepID=A0A367LBS4_9HYPO|nr:hypothetical protein L249_4186 [Ophiocordyceps polyrhachis-furcata BCC 54312]
MLRYSFALRSRSGLQRQQQQQQQQRQQTQKDHLITGCQEGGRTRGPRQQTSRPSSFLRQGIGFYEKLRRHEARRPKTKDTIDWLEKHAFFYRKVGPGPGPDESTEHSYGLFQALPKEIQVQLYDKLERPSSSPYGILFSTAYFLTQIQLEDNSYSGFSSS